MKTSSALAGAVICFCTVAWGQGVPKSSPESAANTPPSGKATEGIKSTTGRTGPTGQTVPSGQSSQDRQTSQNNPAAQTTQQRQSTSERLSSQTSSPETSSSSDQQIAAFLCGAAHNEIELAKFAQTKLQSPEAKQFAERMIREHTPSCEKMKGKAGNLVAHLSSDSRSSSTLHTTGSSSQSTTASNQAASTQRGNAASSVQQATYTAPVSGGSGDAGAVDWVRIHQEIGEQCLAKTKEELSSKQGADFDKAFMGQQCVGHVEMIAKLEALRNHASSELRQDIEKEIEMANSHLQLAKQVKEQLKDDAGSARQPTGKKN
jgi:predicted outer membrane protein